MWCLAYAPVPLRSVQNSKIWNCDCPLLPNISYPLMYSSRITLPNDESVKKQLALNHKKFHLFASSKTYKALWFRSVSSGQGRNQGSRDRLCRPHSQLIWTVRMVVTVPRPLVEVQIFEHLIKSFQLGYSFLIGVESWIKFCCLEDSQSYQNWKNFQWNRSTVPSEKRLDYKQQNAN